MSSGVCSVGRQKLHTTRLLTTRTAGENSADNSRAIASGPEPISNSVDFSRGLIRPVKIAHSRDDCGLKRLATGLVDRRRDAKAQEPALILDARPRASCGLFQGLLDDDECRPHPFGPADRPVANFVTPVLDPRDAFRQWLTRSASLQASRHDRERRGWRRHERHDCAAHQLVSHVQDERRVVPLQHR